MEREGPQYSPALVLEPRRRSNRLRARRCILSEGLCRDAAGLVFWSYALLLPAGRGVAELLPQELCGHGFFFKLALPQNNTVLLEVKLKPGLLCPRYSDGSSAVSLCGLGV